MYLNLFVNLIEIRRFNVIIIKMKLFNRLNSINTFYIKSIYE